MEYTVEKIDNGVATVVFSGGSWAQVVMTADMSEEDFDDLVMQFAPKTGEAPSFVQVGQTRTAANKTLPEGESVVQSQDPEPQWLLDRKEAYGSLSSQIEYITENGLEAWQTHAAEIKAMFPKS